MINKLKYKANSGLTMIEMAIVMTVFSIAGLGLVSSAISIVGFYQDDLVLKDIRSYGNAVLKKVSEKIQEAQTIKTFSGPSGYDIVYLTYPGGHGQSYSIQATEDHGFLWQGQEMFPYSPLVMEGMYRDAGQRDIALTDFWVKDMLAADYEPVQNRNNIRVVAKSVYEVGIVYELTTHYQDGDDITEYLTFKKKVYAYQNLIHRM